MMQKKLALVKVEVDKLVIMRQKKTLSLNKMVEWEKKAAIFKVKGHHLDN